MLSRENSICRGLPASFGSPFASSGASRSADPARSTLATHQSYSGRWSSNSSVHSEWVMPSTASLSECA